MRGFFAHAASKDSEVTISFVSLLVSVVVVDLIMAPSLTQA